MSATRYPVYIPSKGRADCCLTARVLVKERVPFFLVVEPQEADAYAAEFGRERLLILPFQNLGIGSMPARNWIWEHARASGAKRHWAIDDNISGFWRRWKARKIRCDAGAALSACEDFTDRYENVAVSGLNYYMFSINKTKQPPFYLNVHVYSCMLIDTALPFRWRGKHNEDVDLCLQSLSRGYCTILLNAFLAWKMTTMTMKGGNTDTLYQGDGRARAARYLQRAWPGVVEVKRRFNRPHHVVKGAWAGFDTPLKLRAEVNLSALPKVDEKGMELQQVKPIKSETLRAFVAGRG